MTTPWIRSISRCRAAGFAALSVVGWAGVPAAAQPATPCWDEAHGTEVNAALAARLGPTGAWWRAVAQGEPCRVWLQRGALWFSTPVSPSTEPELAASELAWSVSSAESAVAAAFLAARPVADGLRAEARQVAQAALSSRAPVAPVRPAPPDPWRAVSASEAGLGVTLLNGDPVPIVSGSVALLGTRRLRLTVGGWAPLTTVESQYVYARADGEVAPELRVAGVEAGVRVGRAWRRLDLGFAVAAGGVWAATDVVEIDGERDVSGWMPQASFGASAGWVFGPMRVGALLSYRVVAGDASLVGPERWALTGPAATLSVGWERP